MPGQSSNLFPPWLIAFWRWLLKWPLFWLVPLWRHIRRFLTNPHGLIGSLAVLLWRWFVRSVRAAASNTVWFVRKVTTLRIMLQVLRVWLIVVGSYYLIFSHIENQMQEKADDQRTVVYLSQGDYWLSANSPNRQTYYYTPQGANVREIRYNWFIHLERPWKKDRFAEPKYMRSYGFIVDPAASEANPDDLPIGLTHRWDRRMGEMALDLTCAACHTGQLDFETRGMKYAVRIDGGPALHDLTDQHPGYFAGDLGASMLATSINPFKFYRFCRSAIPNDPIVFCARLWGQFSLATMNIFGQTAVDQWRGLYPVEEGYGRTDALGRIANNTFATNLNQLPSNYKVANAPVSYPPVWDIWKLDWVQYTGSVTQPMARNIGESLGTGAKYYLLDTYNRVVSRDARYETSASIAGLNRIENALRDLTPPEWPESVFGKIDRDKAEAGKHLFYEHCYRCHGPFYPTCAQMHIQAPLKQGTGSHWVTKMIPLDIIGTDKTSAMNFVDNRYDLTTTGVSGDDIRTILEPTYKELWVRTNRWCKDEKWCKDDAGTDELTYLRRNLGPINPSAVSVGQGLTFFIGFIRSRAYQEMNLTREQMEELNGFAQLDTPHAEKSYRPRPLMGIWATPPFLHNGSVPTLYEMLVPATQRSKVFYVKSRSFDAWRVGLRGDPNEKNVFVFDTTIPGNLNIGHEFRAGFRPYTKDDPPWSGGGAPPKPRYGVIGPELTEEERFRIIEYLKVMKEADFPPPDSEVPPDVDRPEPKTDKTGCPAVPVEEMQYVRKQSQVQAGDLPQ